MNRLRLPILGLSLLGLGVCALAATDGHFSDVLAQAPEPPPTVSGTVASDGSQPPTGQYQRFPRIPADPDPDYGPHPTVFRVSPATIPTAYPYGVDQVPKDGVVNFTGTAYKSEYPIRFEVESVVPGKRTFGFSAPDGSWFASPYFTYDENLSCSATSCTPNLDATLYAKYGSVGGKVTLKDGSSLGKIFFVSARPKEPYPSPAPDERWRTYTTVTTEEGDYDFAASSLEVTDRNDPCLIDGVKYHCRSIPIATANEWGLPVLGNGGIDGRDKHVFSTATGEYDYTVAVNSTIADGIKETTVRSSVASLVNFELELEDYEETLKYQRTNRPFQEDGPEDKQGQCGGNNTVPLGYGGGPAVAPRPVSLITGNVFLDHEDVRLPGIRQDLVFVRSYNSVMDRDSRFGVGWSDSFDKRIEVLSTTGIRVWGPDGNAMYFTDPDRDGVFRPYGAPNGGSWIARSGPDFLRTFRSGGYEEYKGTGQLKKRVDRTGRTITFTYDGAGRLTDIVSPEGRRLRLEYSGSYVSRLTGPMGVIAEYSYTYRGYPPDQQFQLTQVRYVDGTGYHFTYDDASRLLSVADLAGLVLENHGYDAQGRAAFSELSNGLERRTYTFEEGRTLVTDARGTVSTFEWTQKRAGRFMTRVTGCDFCGSSSGTRTWEVDDEGRTTRYVDADNNVTVYRWEGTNLVGITNALGHETVLSGFDQFGRPGSMTVPGQGTTTFVYGPDGLTAMTLPTGQTTTLTYDNQRLTEIMAAGLTTELEIDDLGDVRAVTDTRGKTTTFTYDAMGRVTTATTPDHHTTRLERTAGGRVSAIIRPDGKRIEIHVDVSGRPSSVEDEADRTYGRTYDRYSRVQSVSDPLGSTRFEYDQMSSVTALADPLHRKTVFDYDAFGRLRAITDPAHVAETYEYHPSGLLRVRTDRKGVSRTFLYDGLARLTSVTYSDGTPHVTIAYDDLARTVTVANGTDTISRHFDQGGRLLSESSTFNGSSVSYTYTDAHERATLSLNGSRIATYGYTDGYLDSIKADGHTFGFDYDDAGRRRTLTFPNGLETSYEYDAVMGWLKRLGTSLTGTAAWDIAYTHDVVGNRLSRAMSGTTETYRYDEGDQLIQADRSAATPRTWSWAFDDAGNRTSETVDGIPTSMSHDVRNRLTSTQGGGTVRVEGRTTEPASVTVDGHPARMLSDNAFVADVPAAPGQTTFAVEARDAAGNIRTSTYRIDVAANGATYSYDANGRLVAKTQAAETWTYEWNGANQLVRVLTGGSEVVRFAYDGLSRRVEKVANGATTRYVYDGSNIIRETRSGISNATFTYVHGPGIDEPLARRDTSGSWSYYHADGLGSIVKMTDASGAVVASHNYEAWGNPEGTVPDLYAFTAREHDAETGLIYYRARYYDPKIGRFISEDPISFLGGVNFYAYVSANPVNRVDPSGLQDSSSPWQVGWEWLSGSGPRTRAFGSGDPFTESLRQHGHVNDTLALIQGRLNAGETNFSGSNPYRLSGFQGVPKYCRDYSTLATGGMTGNLAVTYLGSYNLGYTVTTLPDGTVSVNFTASNTSTFASGTRPPVIGYTPWWDQNVAQPLNNAFSSGPMSPTQQTFTWSHTIR